MKKVLKIALIVVIVLGIALTGVYYAIFNSPVHVTTKNIGNEKPLTVEQKLEDFEYMYNIMKDNFPYFEVKKRTLGYDWLAHKSEFEGWVKKTKNDIEFYNTMNRILALLQNGHTGILSPDYYKMFVKLYGSIPLVNGLWNQVLNNKNVVNRYKYWGKIINEKQYVIPVVFKYFEGNYAAICDINKDDPKKYGIERGSILKKVGDLTIDEYINSLRDKAFLQYDFKRNILKKDQLLIYTKNIENIKLILLTPEGKSIEKEIKSIEYTPPKSDNNKLPNYQSLILKENRIAYLKVRSLDGLSVDKDHDGIYKFLKSIKDYPYLIIDIRGNGGGSDYYWMKNIVPYLTDKALSASNYLVIRNGDYIKPFFKAKFGPGFNSLKSTKELPDNLNFPYELRGDFGKFSYDARTVSSKDPVGFKGKIYILTDGYVYSSAESFAAFAKATKWATLVGTTTGGDGIGTDPVLCALPNSGLVFRFSADMGINPDGTINEEKHTSPDVYVEQSYNDYFKLSIDDYKKNDLNDMLKYDTVVKKVLEIAK